MRLLSFVIFAVFASVVVGGPDSEASERTLNRGTAEQYSFSGQPRWQVSELLTSRTVSINCTADVRIFPSARLRTDVTALNVFSRPAMLLCTLRFLQFQVYSGRSEDEIDELYRNGARSWCSSSLSWDSWFVKGYRKCEVTISPFGETIVTVVPEDAVLKQKKLSCSQTERSELSLQLLVSGLAGLVLFYTAPHLATSVAFRVSVGGTLSVFLCTLIIAIFFFRSAPQALVLAHSLSRSGWCTSSEIFIDRS